MNIRSALVIAIFIISCKTETTSWQTFDFKAFKIKAPAGWRIFKEKGIDSFVGGLTNGKDSMWFDYGWYSAEIKDEDFSKHLYGQDTINGLIAIIQIPKVDGKGSIRLSIPHVNDKDKFNLGGYNIKGTDTILKIFKSIIFEESDTTKNSNLSLGKFKEFPFGSGRTLYYSYCSSCHFPDRFMTGPPLKDVLKDRDNDWVYRFLTNKETVVIDSLYKARVKEARDMLCIEFPDLTKNDVEQILSYIKGQ